MDTWCGEETSEELERQVKIGAEWLDSIKPNWPTLIDFETLEMMETDQCICGQVFAREAEEADGSYRWPECDGYIYAVERLGLGVVETEEKLTEAFAANVTKEFWEKEVKARLDKGVNP